jgi:hypothetical protein
MRKILILLSSLLPFASYAEEKKDSMKVIDVAIPMLCGDYKDLRQVLDDGGYSDLGIGKDKVTRDTYITIAYSGKNQMFVVGQWSDDMSFGCLAYTAGESRFVKDVDKLLAPKPNL